MRLLAQWILNAISLLIVTHFVPGFHIGNLSSALIAALVISLVNVIVGIPLKFLALPLRMLTFGIFTLVINAFLLELSSKFVSGFSVNGFRAAFIAAVLLALLHAVWRLLLEKKKERD